MYRSISFVNFATVLGVPGSYDQYCPIARSLDVLGDRWTLLVLRELSMSPQRFTDLRNQLKGIPPNVLSQRLKRLVDDGLVVIEELPPPAARSVYTLTPRGREAVPILRALVRFGTSELEPATPEHRLRPPLVVASAFLAWFDEIEARRIEVAEHYDLVMDGERQSIRSLRPTLWRGPESPPAVTVEGPTWAFARLRQGSSLGDAPLVVTGSEAARSRFRRIYALT